MDREPTYREIVKQILTETAQYFDDAATGLQTEAIFDDAKGHYQVGQVGWLGKQRIDQVYIHLDVIGEKVWIQRDATDLRIADDLERAGIPKQHIVLGFQHPDRRPDTDYAVA